MDKKKIGELGGSGSVQMNKKLSKEKHKGGGEPVPNRAITWFKEMLERRQEISMQAFCDKFGLKCEEDARTAFSSLLSSSLLPEKARRSADEKYQEWRRNDGALYWASRSNDYITDLLTEKTVGGFLYRGEYFTSKRLYSLPRDDHKGNFVYAYAVRNLLLEEWCLLKEKLQMRCAHMFCQFFARLHLYDIC